MAALAQALRQATLLGASGRRAWCALQLRCVAAAPSNPLELIKQLRADTGAPMTDVKQALQAANWDVEAAVTELRKKGLAAATKKASRHAAEGLVGVARGDGAAAVVEINSETDFVARNEQFVSLVGSAAAAALQAADARGGGGGGGGSTQLEPGALAAATLTDGTTLEQATANVAATVRENVRLRRGFHVASPGGGVVGAYLHGKVGESAARIAGLVALAPDAPLADAAAREQAQDLANKLAMQVVGAVPRYLDRTAVPAEDLEAERKVLREQALKSGKPEKIVDKIVAGRLDKWYADTCLLEQQYLLDSDHKVSDVLQQAGQALNTRLRLAAFLRVQVGEGLEAEQKDFAAEVAETLKATA